MEDQFPLKTDFHVEDFELECPYLPDRQATFRYWLPGRPVSLQESADRMAAGQRRHGQLLYSTACQNCQRCISLRVPIETFQFSKSQKRIWNRGNRKFRRTVGPPSIDGQRIALLNKHHLWRGWLETGELSAIEYRNSFLTETLNCIEVCYYESERLVGVAICDVGNDSLSAVYTFYDPDFQKDSLGTFSILNQIDLCKERSYRYLYLGFYVAECPSLSYKDKFRPNQILKDGKWLDHR